MWLHKHFESFGVAAGVVGVAAVDNIDTAAVVVVVASGVAVAVAGSIVGIVAAVDKSDVAADFDLRSHIAHVVVVVVEPLRIDMVGSLHMD